MALPRELAVFDKEFIMGVVMVRSNEPAFLQESEMVDEPDFVLDECWELRGNYILRLVLVQFEP